MDFESTSSIIAAICTLVEKITRLMDSKNSVWSIFVDLIKVFDCVQHEIGYFYKNYQITNNGIRNVSSR